MPYANKEDYKAQQKRYQQTKKHRMYEWKRKGMKIPDEDLLWDRWNKTNHCELCNIQVVSGGGNPRKCLDHDHHSGYVRWIVCNKCNCNLGSTDNKKMFVMLELHRLFHRI